MSNTSSIKIITMLTLCLGLIAGGSVAQAKTLLIHMQKLGRANTFSESTLQYIDLGAPEGDPKTITFKTKKKKGQTVAVWFSAACHWKNTNGTEFVTVGIQVDDYPVGSTGGRIRCRSNPDWPGSDTEVLDAYGAVTVDKGVHTIRVRVDPVNLGGSSEELTISNTAVMVLIQ